MTRLQSTVRAITYSLIASVALSACTVVSITDDPPTRAPHATTTPVYAGIQLPDHVLTEIRADNVDAVLSPCPTEDSDNCYWDAVSRANNQGSSFIVWHSHYYYNER